MIISDLLYTILLYNDDVKLKLLNSDWKAKHDLYHNPITKLKKNINHILGNSNYRFINSFINSFIRNMNHTIKTHKSLEPRSLNYLCGRYNSMSHVKEHLKLDSIKIEDTRSTNYASDNGSGIMFNIVINKEIFDIEISCNFLQCDRYKRCNLVEIRLDGDKNGIIFDDDPYHINEYILIADNRIYEGDIHILMYIKTVIILDIIYELGTELPRNYNMNDNFFRNKFLPNYMIDAENKPLNDKTQEYIKKYKFIPMFKDMDQILK
jgi:hypothetical protein